MRIGITVSRSEQWLVTCYLELSGYFYILDTRLREGFCSSGVVMVGLLPKCLVGFDYAYCLGVRLYYNALRILLWSPLSYGCSWTLPFCCSFVFYSLLNRRHCWFSSPASSWLYCFISRPTIRCWTYSEYSQSELSVWNGKPCNLSLSLLGSPHYQGLCCSS